MGKQLFQDGKLDFKILEAVCKVLVGLGSAGHRGVVPRVNYHMRKIKLSMHGNFAFFFQSTKYLERDSCWCHALLESFLVSVTFCFIVWKRLAQMCFCILHLFTIFKNLSEFA